MTEKQYTPPPIDGYRKLSQAEVDLMNRIKAHGEQLAALLTAVDNHLNEQERAAEQAGDENEQVRIGRSDCRRWKAIGRTHLQEGLMALTRAVAQPSNF